MKVLLSGIAGFIGSHVAEALVRRGVFETGTPGDRAGASSHGVDSVRRLWPRSVDALLGLRRDPM